MKNDFTVWTANEAASDIPEEPAVEELSDWDDFDYLGETPFPHFG